MRLCWPGRYVYSHDTLSYDDTYIILLILLIFTDALDMYWSESKACGDQFFLETSLPSNPIKHVANILWPEVLQNWPFEQSYKCQVL